jgi:hypothetical protein
MPVILRQKERKGKRKDNSISISVFRREKREWRDSRGRNTRFFGSTIVGSRLGGFMALKSADANEFSRRGSNRTRSFLSWGREGWARFLRPAIPDSTASSLSKTLPAEKVADAGCKRRFLLEAQAASRLNRPNTVTI